MVITGVVYALPNFYGEDYAIQLSRKSSLASTQQVSKNALVDIKRTLSTEGVPYIDISDEGKSNYLIRFSEAEQQIKARDVLQAAFGHDYAVALNLAPRTPQWLLNLGASPMRLGLDLRGGIHFLLYVNVPAMLKERFQQDVHKMGQLLRDDCIRYSSIVNKAGQVIEIRFKNGEALKKAQTALSSNLHDYDISANDDSSTLSLSINPKALQDLRQYAITQNINTLRNKVNDLGVAEPVIQQQGADHISVDLPGIQDSARAKAMIGTVATVRLQLVDVENDAQQAALTGIVPAGDTLYYLHDDSMPGQPGRPYLLKNEVALTGQSITNAVSTMDQNSGTPAVDVSTSGAGVSEFYRITSQNIGKPLAVVYVETKTKQVKLNGQMKRVSFPQARLINVATINSALSNFTITGLSMQEAKDLALQLRSGAYTAPVSYDSQQMVGPSLGKTNIRNGVMSCLVGSLLVIVFMLFYYRWFGFAANLALISNLILITGFMSLIGATLTLPGIAGIVLTVGMAVDANVLIFSRIREELGTGTSPQEAIKEGFSKAFTTIFDANITTLIAAIVLYAIGTGPVKGFAITLSIGILTSMFTAILGTRAVVNLMYGQRNLKELKV